MSTLTEITVGPSGADVIGSDGRAIQIAIDAMAYRGGGVVKVLPGTYTLSGPVRLRSHVALVGDKDKTILVLGPVVCSRLAVDADIGQKQITPIDASPFCEGMGVVMRDNAKPNAMATTPRTITKIEDGVLHLDDWITNDWIADNGAMLVSYFPLLHGFEVEDVTVDGFTLDAAPDSTEGLDEINGALQWGGCMYVRRGQRCTVRNVKAMNCCGDGFRNGQSRYITYENCESAHNTHYGMHPGSHSPYTTARNCHIHHNGSDGLYLCWGVCDGEFTDNDIHHNGGRIHRNGISIGHKDTDNLIARNHVYENAKHGICFRIKTAANGAHRNIVRENVIENNGSAEDKIPAVLAADPRNEVLCAGVHVRGITCDLTFERNVIVESRDEGQRYQHNAFYFDKGVSGVKLIANELSDHPGGAIADDSGGAVVEM